MAYMHELELKLKDLLDAFAAGDLSRDAFIGDIKLITLESYRNGVEAGKTQNSAATAAPAAGAPARPEAGERRTRPAPRRGMYRR